MTEIKVRGYHADFYGHVNNARYLEFLEEDRWTLLEESLDVKKLAASGFGFLVVNININYRRAVPVGETVVVSTHLEKIGSKSAVLRQEIVFKDSPDKAVDALITFVIADRSGRAVVLEGIILEQIKKLAR